MPTPTLITDLSTTAASNFPASSDSPSVLDDVQRAHAAFIAQIRDAVPVSSGGNLTFTGTGNRIKGDFSNATVANRVMFQTSTVNGGTYVGITPNGSGNGAISQIFAASDVANTAVAQIYANASRVAFDAAVTGTGTYLPMTFYTSGSERLRIDTSGNVTVTSAAGLGYGTGAGGTVTQATSKSTAVTLNKPTGRITTNNAALAAGATVEFTVNNSLFSVDDCVVLSGLWGLSPNYRIELKGVVSGGFAIRLTNITAGSLSEAVGINFAKFNGATS